MTVYYSVISLNSKMRSCSFSMQDLIIIKLCCEFSLFENVNIPLGISEICSLHTVFYQLQYLQKHSFALITCFWFLSAFPKIFFYHISSWPLVLSPLLLDSALPREMILIVHFTKLPTIYLLEAAVNTSKQKEAVTINAVG